MTYKEQEELVKHITEDLEWLATKRCNVTAAIVTMLDNIKQYPSGGDYRADIPIEARDPIKNNKWIT